MYVIQSHPKHPILLNFTRVEKLGWKNGTSPPSISGLQKKPGREPESLKMPEKKAKHLQTTPRKIDMEPENTGPPALEKENHLPIPPFLGVLNVHLRGCIIFVGVLSHSFLQGPPAWTVSTLGRKNPPKNEKTASSHHPHMPCDYRNMLGFCPYLIYPPWN